jgi:hypothetical protein
VDSLFGWLVADGWCWFVMREEYCWPVAGDWFVLREKYCYLVADKPSVRFQTTTLYRSSMDVTASLWLETAIPYEEALQLQLVVRFRQSLPPHHQPRSFLQFDSAHIFIN